MGTDVSVKTPFLVAASLASSAGWAATSIEKRRLGDRLYLVPGSPNTLVYESEERIYIVDPGIGEGRCEALYTLIGKPADILLTHGHTDHLAAAPCIARSVAAHRLCVTLVESMDARKALVYGGLVSDDFAAMPRVELRVYRVLEWGERVVDNVYAIRLDGHTPGHTGFVFEDDGVVALGDALVGEKVVETYGLPYALDAKRWLETLNSIERLAEKGYTLIPGHGPVLRGERAYKVIETNKTAVLKARELILEALDKQPMSLEELTILVTRRLARIKPSPRNISLNRVTVSSILAWLQEEKLVSPEVGEKGVIWRLVKK